MPRSEEVRPARGKNLSLPVQLWPEADRNAWVAACKPATRLRRGGAASHLEPVTRDDHAADYGNFLGFLDRRGLLGRDGLPAANVTPGRVERYLNELRGRLASTTLHVTICRLRRIARYIAPSRDLAWLAEIGKDLKLVARPRSQSDRLVLTEVLAEAGITLILEAELSRNMTKLDRACQVRNGLMVALLAFCPIRRKNFTALEIGRSIVKIRGTWWIVLSASETKEKRADERPIDELLTPVIDRYLGQHRPILARGSNPPSALWLSAKNGTPIGDHEVANIIRMTTLSTVGVAVSPHLFRAAGASSAALLGGENPYLGSALLHHTDPSLTNAHYNRATSLSAAETFRQLVRQYEQSWRKIAAFE